MSCLNLRFILPSFSTPCLVHNELYINVRYYLWNCPILLSLLLLLQIRLAVAPNHYIAAPNHCNRSLTLHLIHHRAAKAVFPHSDNITLLLGTLQWLPGGSQGMENKHILFHLVFSDIPSLLETHLDPELKAPVETDSSPNSPGSGALFRTLRTATWAQTLIFILPVPLLFQFPLLPEDFSTEYPPLGTNPLYNLQEWA